MFFETIPFRDGSNMIFHTRIIWTPTILWSISENLSENRHSEFSTAKHTKKNHKSDTNRFSDRIGLWSEFGPWSDLRTFGERFNPLAILVNMIQFQLQIGISHSNSVVIFAILLFLFYSKSICFILFTPIYNKDIFSNNAWNFRLSFNFNMKYKQQNMNQCDSLQRRHPTN